MLSIVISAYKEPGISKAIESILSQKINESYELIIIAPDKETEKIVKSFQKQNKSIIYFKDQGKGKVNGLNEVFPACKGRVIILTDGDVYLGENSINSIINAFKDKSIGCISGRPVTLNQRTTMLGYWSHLLYDAAHKVRYGLSSNGKFLEASGYLFAFLNDGTIKTLPPDVAEDSITPYYFYKKGYSIGYVPEAKVYVKNPTNTKDFIKQRKRTNASHSKLSYYASDMPRVKTFWNEIRIGTFFALGYPMTFKEFVWTLALFFIRLYAWLSMFLDSITPKKTVYRDDWERIESTK
ncbi:glycosyltransferase [Candidatus Woesearchaeota archaeon]|nr:glycosyltransferase [Candidatus Woesearchaeota archaeon]